MEQAQKYKRANSEILEFIKKWHKMKTNGFLTRE